VKTVENHQELSKSTQGRGGKNVNLRCLFPQDSSKYSMRRPSIPSFDESWKCRSPEGMRRRGQNPPDKGSFFHCFHGIHRPVEKDLWKEAGLIFP
jgi:hypothetical protein